MGVAAGSAGSADQLDGKFIGDIDHVEQDAVSLF